MGKPYVFAQGKRKDEFGPMIHSLSAESSRDGRNNVLGNYRPVQFHRIRGSALYLSGKSVRKSRICSEEIPGPKSCT